MSFLYPPPPPPPITTASPGGSSSTTIVIPHPQYDSSIHADVMNDTSPSPSPSASIIIVIIVIASAIIVSASIYLLLRFLSRRCHRTFRTFSSTSVADDVVLQNRRISVSGCVDDRRVADSSLFDSLPLFTFGSVTGKLAAGDCAVCLSKFEPQDQLRLLPLCCHAFHAHCIDTWLASNLTCPLCRIAVNASDADVLSKIIASSEGTQRNNDMNSNGNNNVNRSGSFRVEIGSISSRRGTSDTSGDGRRSYSIGSFDYIVDDGCEVPVDSTHHRGVSDCTSTDKESFGIPVTGPPGESLAAEVAGGRSWLRDYVDRLSSFSFSSRTMSFRSSGRYMFGSSRRNDVVVPVADLEANPNPIGEEIGEYFRWLSGV
ncbi:E3 ubiquitin-protein ligase ATL4-like [Coffea arabica]|uniref:RING-type E3 ubiquitin transferase n=1 Tax=Coffea arabica TaxID=13443 RepID=A0A6P6WDR6_COFAR|nr:E3 ubiquitin-protein ligase ATL4-like [Coffea arabica]